ncbi:NAD(P)-binding protein [Peniophora sp. CONT]|nr:NAD(P)-binding protein [Peniophora sp. CONT]
MATTAPFKVAAKRVAIVTGGARGIGRSIALRLARDGHDVAVADVHGSSPNEVAQEIAALGRRSMTHDVDVTQEREVANLVSHVADRLGSVDIMVANAGIAHIGSVLDTSLEDYRRVMDTNAQGVYLCYKYAGLKMVEQGRGGRIIGASSLLGKVGDKAWFAYTASKFAVRGMTQAAALELAPHGITVNAYAPGSIDTRMFQETATKTPGAAFMNLPVGRLGAADEIAAYVSWVTSEHSGFVTGQSVSINGGAYFD